MFSFLENYISSTHIKVMKMLFQQVSLQVLKSVVNDDVLNGPHNLVKCCLRLNFYRETFSVQNFQDPEFWIYPEDFNPCYEYLVTYRAEFTNFCFWVIIMGTFSRFFLKNWEILAYRWPKKTVKTRI